MTQRAPIDHRLEDSLEEAYRRRGAPPGFTNAVLSRAERESSARSARRWPTAARAGAWAVAASIAVAAALTVLRHSPREAVPHASSPSLSLIAMPTLPVATESPSSVSVPSLSELGGIPLFPARPSFGADGTVTEPQSWWRHDRKSHGVRERAAISTHPFKETCHESTTT